MAKNRQSQLYLDIGIIVTNHSENSLFYLPKIFPRLVLTTRSPVNVDRP